MGASFLTTKLPGSLSRKEVEQKFAFIQDQDRYENGHSYSGGFGMALGLEFHAHAFDNDSAAEEWLDSHCQKWGAALCVSIKGEGGDWWMIGAVCAS
jgi:hypothetical protein